MAETLRESATRPRSVPPRSSVCMESAAGPVLDLHTRLDRRAAKMFPTEWKVGYTETAATPAPARQVSGKAVYLPLSDIIDDGGVFAYADAVTGPNLSRWAELIVRAA